MERELYNAPAMEIVEFAVESGFAESQQEPAPWEDL